MTTTEQEINQKLISFRVYTAGEYAMVFVEQRCLEHRGKPRYCGTLAIVSSFGVYGHEWGHCGKPFVEFLQDLNPDYLLSKISALESTSELVLRAVRNEVLQLRRNRAISAQEARDAWEEMNFLEEQGLPVEALSHELYQSAELPDSIDWANLGETQAWPLPALRFMEVLWPLIVDRLQQMAVPLNRVEIPEAAT